MQERKKFVLETQMRSGTHYFLSALVRTYNPYIHFPLRSGETRELTMQDITDGLDGNAPSQKEVNDQIEILFRHYYHNLRIDKNFALCKKIALIGSPFDSFYSDGIVLSYEDYSPAPSTTRDIVNEYQLRLGSKEWDALLPSMRKNAVWLHSLINNQDGNVLIVRYEDLINNFAPEWERVEAFLEIEKIGTPIPPLARGNRMYWKHNYSKKLDRAALSFIFNIFKDSIENFYPEICCELKNILSDK